MNLKTQWQNVISTGEFSGLSADERRYAASRFFDEKVRDSVPEEFHAQVFEEMVSSAETVDKAGIGGYVKEFGLGLLRGVPRAVQMAGRVTEAVSPRRVPDIEGAEAAGLTEGSFGSHFGRSLNELVEPVLEKLDDASSDGIKVQKQRPLIRRGEDGEFQGLNAIAPGAVVGPVGEVLPQIPLFLLAARAGGGALGAAGVGKIAARLGQLSSKGRAVNAGAVNRAGGLAISGGTVGGGMGAGAVYDEALQYAYSLDEDMPKAKAEAFARDAVEAALPKMASLSAVTGLAGFGLAEKVGASKFLGQSAPARFAKGAAADTPFEMVEEGGQSVLADVAIGRDIDLDRAAQGAAISGVASAPVGGAFGLQDGPNRGQARPRNDRTEVPNQTSPEPAPPAEPQPADAPTVAGRPPVKPKLVPTYDENGEFESETYAFDGVEKRFANELEAVNWYKAEATPEERQAISAAAGIATPPPAAAPGQRAPAAEAAKPSAPEAPPPPPDPVRAKADLDAATKELEASQKRLKEAQGTGRQGLIDVFVKQVAGFTEKRDAAQRVAENAARADQPAQGSGPAIEPAVAVAPSKAGEAAQSPEPISSAPPATASPARQEASRPEVAGQALPEPDRPDALRDDPGGPIEDRAPPVDTMSDQREVTEVPVGELQLSDDVPQFKSGARSDGVVEPLGGSFDRRGVAPIQVWERKDGRLEVISGRHRFDLAKRGGEQSIPAQVYREADGFSREQAATLDAELNIRDGQGSVADYVGYFSNAALTREEANDRGLLSRAKGKAGWRIADSGSQELIAALGNKAIADQAAEAVAVNAPGNARLQNVGLQALMKGESIGRSVNLMRAVQAMSPEGQMSQQGDMFGLDDSAMVEAKKMAQTADSIQRGLREQVSAVSGAARRPEQAAKLGVNVADPDGVRKRIDELRAEASQWDNWMTEPALVAQVRQEAGLTPLTRKESEADAPPPEPDIPEDPGLFDQTPSDGGFSLAVQTESSRQQDEARVAKSEAQQQAQRQQAERRAQSEREASDFVLTGSDRPADVAAARGQNDLFAPRTDEGSKAEKPAVARSVATESKAPVTREDSGRMPAGDAKAGPRPDSQPPKSSRARQADEPAPDAKGGVAQASKSDARAVERLSQVLNLHHGRKVKLEPSGAPRAYRRMAEAISAMFGKKTAFFTSTDPLAPAGAFLQGDTLFVNAGALQPVRHVIGHEFTHSLEESNPGMYAEMKARVLAMAKEGALPAYLDRINSIYEADGIPPLARDAAEREFVADAVGAIISDPQVLLDVKQAMEPSAFQRFINQLSEFIDGLIAKIRGDDRQQGTFAEKNIADLQGIQNLVRDVLYATATGQVASTDAAAADPASSGGRPAFSRDQTETPEFKQWFGDSKAVDDDGRPLVLYHGTDADFEAFDPVALNGHKRNGRLLGPGYYFTTDREQAAKYGDRVISAYLRIENPRTHTAAGPLADRSDDQDGTIAIGTPGTRMGHRVFVVKRPEQIKSATGNNGNFDPEDPRIAFSRRDQAEDDNASPALKRARAKIAPQESKFTRGIQYFMDAYKNRGKAKGPAEYSVEDELKRSLFDDLHPLKVLDGLIESTFGDNSDSYKLARISRATPERTHVLLHHGFLKFNKNGTAQSVNRAGDKTRGEGFLPQLRDILKDETQINNWLQWMVGRRASEMLGKNRESLFAPDEVAELLKLGDGKPEFQKAADLFNEFNNSVLDIAVASGYIGKDDRKKFQSEFYLPFHRMMEEGNKALNTRGLDRGLAVANMKRLLGGEQALKDPLENIIANWSGLLDSSAKTLASKAAVDQMKRLGLANRMPPKRAQRKVNVEEIASKLTEKGASPGALPPAMKADMVSVWVNSNPMADDVVTFFEGGERQFYQITDPALFEAIAGNGLVTGDIFDSLLKPFTLAKNLITFGATSNPAFWARSIIRESMTSMGVAKDGSNPITTLARLKSSYVEDQIAVDAMASGGTFLGSYMDANNPAGAARRMRRKARVAAGTAGAGEYIAEAYSKYYYEVGIAFDNASRLDVYRRAIAAGRDPLDAAIEARDLMDYSLRGASGAVQLISRTVPFFNPRLQGLYKLGRAATTRETQIRMGFVTGALTLASMVLYALNNDDERYQKLERWDRDGYWHLFAGDVHLRIPKPFELGVAASILGERLPAVAAEQDGAKELWDATAFAVISTLNLNPVPALAMTGIDLARDKDSFRGTPIVGKYNQNATFPEEERKEYTPSFAIAIAEAMPDFAPTTLRSPDKINFLFNALGATMGRYAMQSASWALDLGDDTPKPAKTALERAPTGGFVRDARSTRDRAVGDFYNLVGPVRDALPLIRDLEKESPDDYDEQLAKIERRIGMPADVARDLDSMVRDLSQIRKDITEIKEAKDIDSATKRLLIDQLQGERNLLAREGLSMVRQAKEEK